MLSENTGIADDTSINLVEQTNISMRKLALILGSVALSLMMTFCARANDASKTSGELKSEIETSMPSDTGKGEISQKTTAADTTSLPATTKSVASPQVGKVVLMGNSITELWPLRGKHLFETHPEIIGKGISGHTSKDMLMRFQKDVIDEKPEIVQILGGANDIALNGGPYNEDSTFNNIKTMVDMARGAGITVILASCLPAEGFKWRPQVKNAIGQIKHLNARLKNYADTEGIVFVDYFPILLNKAGTGMDHRYSDEKIPVHPNAAGYTLLEPVLLEAIERARKSK